MKNKMAHLGSIDTFWFRPLVARVRDGDSTYLAVTSSEVISAYVGSYTDTTSLPPARSLGGAVTTPAYGASLVSPCSRGCEPPKRRSSLALREMDRYIAVNHWRVLRRENTSQPGYMGHRPRSPPTLGPQWMSGAFGDIWRHFLFKK